MFLLTQKVLFKHCDPAGIVFYPRYFEMLNDVVEEFFDMALNYSFSMMHPNNGVPTAQISATFSAPSRLGDTLDLGLTVTGIGRSSMSLDFATHCEGELRFSANSVLVFVDDSGKPTSWPDTLRETIQSQIQGDTL